MKARDTFNSLVLQARDRANHDIHLKVEVQVAKERQGTSRTLTVSSTNLCKPPVVFVARYFHAEPFNLLNRKSSLKLWAKIAGQEKSFSGPSALRYFNSLV